MLQELLEALSEQAVQASKPQLEVANPTGHYAVRKPDGTVDFIGGKVPYRDHKAQDLETIVAFAERFEAKDAKSVSAAIWYNRAKIVALTNDAERFDRVSVDMIRSQQINKLIDLQKQPIKFPQRDFLFILRTVFTQDAFPTEPKLIENLRQVTFKANQEATGNIQRGKTSIGRAASAEADFLDAIPEQVHVSVPLFDNSFLSGVYSINCALEIYEDEQRLQLFPLPGEVEGAFASAEADLCKSLLDLLGKDSKVPVYYGAP